MRCTQPMRIDYLMQDVRVAFRRLLRAPAFSAVTILTLALAIGANTTTFSSLNQFLLRPLPVQRPSELVFLNRGEHGATQSYPNYLNFSARTRTLSGLFAYRIAPVALSQGSQNAHIWG